MRRVTAEERRKSAPDNKHETGRETLDHQYRKIGISAVAAALPYGCDAKNAAYAPAKQGAQLHREEAI